MIIGAHVEGMERRAKNAAPGDNSDEQSIDAVCPLSQVMIVRKDGDEDGRFTTISKAKKIPLVTFEKNTRAGQRPEGHVREVGAPRREHDRAGRAGARRHGRRLRPRCGRRSCRPSCRCSAPALAGALVAGEGIPPAPRRRGGRHLPRHQPDLRHRHPVHEPAEGVGRRGLRGARPSCGGSTGSGRCCSCCWRCCSSSPAR